jgi:hypothetical protein
MICAVFCMIAWKSLSRNRESVWQSDNGYMSSSTYVTENRIFWMVFLKPST